jgi:hypothetical protein
VRCTKTPNERGRSVDRTTMGGLRMSEIEQPEPNPSIPRYRRRRRPRNKMGRRQARIWYTEEEYKQVDESARLCGKLTGVFIREASLGMPHKAQPFRANANLIWELGRSGMALFRLEAIARETGAFPVADRSEKARLELLALIRQIESSKGAVITIRRRE